jgi:tetratricopeptide (TPR) repeat protein
METWGVSEEYLKSLCKGTVVCLVIAAVPCWGMLFYTFTVFGEHDLWNLLLKARPFMAISLMCIFAAIAVTPLLGAWYLRALTNRLRATSVSLSGDKLIKRVRDEEQCVLFSELSALLVVRSWKGTLGTVRLVTQKGPGLILESLERFDEFLYALKQAAPHCAIKEWTVSLSHQRVLWVFLGVACVLLLALLQGIISQTVFYVVLLVLLGFIMGYRSRIAPQAFRWCWWQDQYQALFSAQLGIRYRWLDFAFGAVVLYLLVRSIPEASEALREGQWTVLLKILFTPLILAWIFLVPLVRSARSRRSDRLVLVAILSIVIGIQVIEAKVVSRSEAATKGLKYVEEKRYEAAIPLLEQAYRREPDQTHLAERLAYSYSMTGRHQDVINVLEDLIRRPDQPSDYAWQLLAHACRQTGQWKHLLNIADAAILANPRSVEAYHMAGLAASQIYGLRSAEAREYYTRYVELNRDTVKCCG